MAYFPVVIIHNTIGSLTAIKSHLHEHNVNEFKSLNELINFQKNYSETRQRIISNSSSSLEKEKKSLFDEITQLNVFVKTRKNEVERQLQIELEKLKEQLASFSLARTNAFQEVIAYLKKIAIKTKIRYNQLLFNYRITNSVQPSIIRLSRIEHRYQYIISHFEEAVNKNCLLQLQELERKKIAIDQINNSIYGALGEQKVVKELEKLSDEYILINDFTYSFSPPIHSRLENDYIKSIQIDHLLISPAGIFLIETKNWSEHSLKNVNLRSPVQQVRRTSFAFFKIISGVTKSNLIIKQHHWGDRKIPIRNLIVLINTKPSEEFQFVKVLTLNELLGYVTYFNSTFSKIETEEIASYLLRLSGDDHG